MEARVNNLTPHEIEKDHMPEIPSTNMPGSARHLDGQNQARNDIEKHIQAQENPSQDIDFRNPATQNLLGAQTEIRDMNPPLVVRDQKLLGGGGTIANTIAAARADNDM